MSRCYHRPTLDSFARHHETGEPLPEDLYQKLVAAKNFRSVSASTCGLYEYCLRPAFGKLGRCLSYSRLYPPDDEDHCANIISIDK